MQESQTARLSVLLDAIVADADKESEFLELLAQLEYIGCRKILRTLPYEEVSLSVLRHVADEAAHAMALKAAARAVADGHERSWADFPLSEIGYGYFRELDRRASALRETQGSRYPAVSWVVEQRALWVYPKYLERTKNDDVRRALQKIIAQEQLHSEQFDDGKILHGESKQSLVLLETELWDGLMDALEARFLHDGDVARISFPWTESTSDVRATD